MLNAATCDTRYNIVNAPIVFALTRSAAPAAAPAPVGAAAEAALEPRDAESPPAPLLSAACSALRDLAHWPAPAGAAGGAALHGELATRPLPDAVGSLGKAATLRKQVVVSFLRP